MNLLVSLFVHLASQYMNMTTVLKWLMEKRLKGMINIHNFYSQSPNSRFTST